MHDKTVHISKEINSVIFFVEPEGAHNSEETNSNCIKSELETMDTSEDIGGSAGQIITALRCKLKEKQAQKSIYKCLICMVSKGRLDVGKAYRSCASFDYPQNYTVSH